MTDKMWHFLSLTHEEVPSSFNDSTFAFSILASFVHYRNEEHVLLSPQYLTLNEFEWSAITRECCFRSGGEFCFIRCMLETDKALNYSYIIRYHEEFPS